MESSIVWPKKIMEISCNSYLNLDAIGDHSNQFIGGSKLSISIWNSYWGKNTRKTPERQFLLIQNGNFFFINNFFFFCENIYRNKKVSKSNNHIHKNVTVVLFYYKNDLNIKSNESWFSFRHRYLYTCSLSLSLRLVTTNVFENINLIFKLVYSLKTSCKLIFYIHKRWLKEIIKKCYHRSFSKKKKKKIKKKKSTLPPFALFRLSYRYGLPFVNIFLFSCCSFDYF